MAAQRRFGADAWESGGFNEAPQLFGKLLGSLGWWGADGVRSGRVVRHAVTKREGAQRFRGHCGTGQRSWLIADVAQPA
jgi:hypothetical protein